MHHASGVGENVDDIMDMIEACIRSIAQGLPIFIATV